jgi:transcriptional regulator with XRE-family HTH domain
VLPFCHITLKAKKPVFREKYPDFMRTWGDWIRARRIGLKLTKRQVALRLNVSDLTIYLWEKNRIEPSLAQVPKIIEFLGRDPFEKRTDSLGDKLWEYRRVHGLTQEKMAGQLGVDPSTLAAWERGEHNPRENFLNKISTLLNLCP